MSWLLLFAAGLLEGAWLYGVQKSASFTHLSYSIFAIVSMSTSLLLFAMAIKTIPPSQAYIVWLAVGVCTISIVELVFFKQLFSYQQLLFLSLIVVGVIGLKLTVNH